MRYLERVPLVLVTIIIVLELPVIAVLIAYGHLYR
jgi:hypothetical protein